MFLKFKELMLLFHKVMQFMMTIIHSKKTKKKTLSLSEFVHLKSCKSEFSKIKVRFSDQEFRILKIQNKVNLKLFESGF